jgi:hypothetical protein
MWGLNWGQMIWGQGTPVPTLGFWGLMVLLAALGALGVRRLRGGRPRLVGGIALGLLLLMPISARALPFTFTNGTVADADQVNANFAAVASAQVVGPSASANLVDLVSNGGSLCNGQTGSTTLPLRIGPDGIGDFFTIPTGQTLVVNSVTVQVNSTQPSVVVRIQRINNGSNGPTDFAVVPIVGNVGSVTLTYPTGSIYGPGTQVCVFAPPASGTIAFASAHGYMTSQ